MVTPRFSVVIPLYNKAAHIVETLHSVCAQSFSDFEVIVVDDGSTDGGGERVAALTDPRVRIVTQENAGVSVARNLGAKLARGQYIAFLDADDYWYPWCLEEQDRLIHEFPGLGLYSVGHEILQAGRCYVPDTGMGDSFRGSVPDFMAAYSKGLALVNSSTACMHRDMFAASEGFPPGITCGEDVYVWLRLGIAHGVAHSSRVCARINRDAENRRSESGESEVPYYLLYLDRLLRGGELAGRQASGARLLFRSGVVFSAAGFALDGRMAGVALLRAIPSSRHDWSIRLVLVLLYLTPPGVLRFLKRYRHRRRKD